MQTEKFNQKQIAGTLSCATNLTASWDAYATRKANPAAETPPLQASGADPLELTNQTASKMQALRREATLGATR